MQNDFRQKYTISFLLMLQHDEFDDFFSYMQDHLADLLPVAHSFPLHEHVRCAPQISHHSQIWFLHQIDLRLFRDDNLCSIYPLFCMQPTHINNRSSETRALPFRKFTSLKFFLCIELLTFLLSRLSADMWLLRRSSSLR